MAFTVEGTLGNHIVLLLEALCLARRAGLELVLSPEREPRHGLRLENEGMTTTEDSGLDIARGRTIWDLKMLRDGLQGRRVFPSFPAECEGRFDLVYIFGPSWITHPTAMQVPPAVQSRMCTMRRSAVFGDEEESFDLNRESCSALFRDAHVIGKHPNRTLEQDSQFIKELSLLGHSRRLSSKPMNQPLCIWVHGHSIDRTGQYGREGLHRYMHWVAPARHIVKAARAFRLDSMAFLHIEYGTKTCMPDTRREESHLCIRTHFSGRSEHWALIADVVAALKSVLCDSGAGDSIYLSATNVPEDTVRVFRKALHKEDMLAGTSIENLFDPSERRLLEVELGVQAKTFIGQLGSPVSEAIYYKRRLLGKHTVWSGAMILPDTAELGHFAFMARMSVPE